MAYSIQKVRFSIAESDYYFKEILVKSLLHNPFYSIVKNCNNGHELISQLYFRQESIFLIDLYMPIMSGIEAIKFIRQSGNLTPIITYSATFQEDMFSMLKDLPAVYYCQKKSIIILEVLKKYVLTVSKNYDEYLNEWKAQPLVVQEYMERQQKGWYMPSLIEIQIMKLCYEGLSNKEIGQYLNLSTRTIDTYITRLAQRLGLRNKIDLIRFCVEQGYYNSST
ncbi:response regulator [Elizabethkingia argentiflava]|uniref:Response regulator n=1 Tax=Elizabethkingia argenteiflava TaxID=2681556 RepID=A0A845PU98_9FLAO|nr:response regulator transcription factor [Elizabethkingia argenteiflava]NAW50476.1 response regulator [Elizabethkingia argenteiflava]